MNILVPQGIGDSVWCLFKVQDVAATVGDGIIDLKIACWSTSPAECRALEFLKRFRFVNSVKMHFMPGGSGGPVLLPGPEATPEGYYRYLPDGKEWAPPGIDYLLMPNAALERAIRLEDWLPQFKTNWDIMNDFVLTQEEQDFAKDFVNRMGRYVVFFMASRDGNGNHVGHNRNALWTHQEWVELGDKLHEQYGVNVVVVGTTWDESYYNELISPMVQGKNHWHNYISQWPIGTTLAVLKETSLMVSYQSGLANVCHYFGRPVASFWRPKGDSISTRQYISFDEGMASAWAKPEFLEKGLLLPCIYGRHRVNEILEFAKTHLA